MPDAPSKPDISNIDRNEMTVSWKPPKSDGGSKITQYLLERKEQYQTRWNHVVRTTELKHQVVALKEGTEYFFRVSAENKAGLGPPSEPSEGHIAKPPYGKTVV